MKRFLIYILALVALVGCGRNEVDGPTPDQGVMMSFGAPTVEATDEAGRAGAGSTLMVVGNMQDYSIGVYGMYETGENIFDSQPEDLHFNGANWVYEELQPWNRVMNHEFRAFHPFDPTGSDRAHGLSATYGIQSMTDATRLVLNYYTEVNKFDLMVARATRNPAADAEGVGKVVLNFKHTLSALQFEVKYATPETDKLTYAHIDGICESGTLYYGRQKVEDGEENIRWILPLAKSTELYQWTGSVAFNNTTAAKAFDGDGVVFAIPQTITDGQASFVFKTEAGDDAIQRAYLPAITWEPGKKYVYTMTVRGAELDVSVKIKPWDNKKSNVDIYIQ